MTLDQFGGKENKEESRQKMARADSESGVEAGRGWTFGGGAGAGDRVVKNLAREGESGAGLGQGLRSRQNNPCWTGAGWG